MYSRKMLHSTPDILEFSLNPFIIIFFFFLFKSNLSYCILYLDDGNCETDQEVFVYN